ncbi:MAG TPA: hypothetical protein VMF89_06840, partial [Polyangiales bacterium]|nr:hypothetical protein [Polyangiales bacterium]
AQRELSMSASPWLVSARFDVVAFSLPALIGLMFGVLSGSLAGPDGDTPAWAWLLFVVGVDVAHVHATTLRVYCDPRELARRPWLYGVTPLACLACGVLLYSFSAALFWRCLAYIALFHFVRQQLGWMRLYRRRGVAHSFDRRLDELAIYAATVCPVVVWHTRLPTSFHWFVQGDFIPGLPPVAATLAGVCFGICACVFYARQIWLRGHGEAWAWGKILLFTLTAGTWWGGIVLLANDFAFTVTNVVAHGVPYMLVSHGVARSQQRLDARPARALPIYLLALCALALGEEWLWDACVWHEHAALLATPELDLEQAAPLLVPLLSVPQLTHYLLDGFLWRLDGSNPAFADWLARV